MCNNKLKVVEFSENKTSKSKFTTFKEYFYFASIASVICRSIYELWTRSEVTWVTNMLSKILTIRISEPIAVIVSILSVIISIGVIIYKLNILFSKNDKYKYY